MTLRFACQTYSWQMSLETYRGRIRHMVATAAEAGFAGFEPELVMLDDPAGRGRFDTAELGEILDEHSVELGAMALALPWRGMTESAEEREDADRAIAALAALGGRLVLVPTPGPDRSDLRERQRSAMACMDAVAERAAEQGVDSSFHPNSPPGSVFRTAEDYVVMADLLPARIRYTPDIGHIAKGGMDPAEIIDAWWPRIDHIHIKDLDQHGVWAPTGAGALNVAGIFDLLDQRGYAGWVTVEDESPAAEADPDSAVRASGRFLAGWAADEAL